jgi:hypothetical protein
MKRKLSALLVCLVLTSVTFALNPIVTWKSWRPDPCNTKIKLTIKYPTPLTCEIHLAAAPFGLAPANYVKPGYPFTQTIGYFPPAAMHVATHEITILTPNVIFMYITVVDVNNPVNQTTVIVPVNPGRGPCTFPDMKKFYPVQTDTDVYWNGDLSWDGYVFQPEDPNEAGDPNMEVKWNLQEVDMNYGSAFSIESPICWNDADQPGASQAFTGFNGFDAATSISQLQAGNCASVAGMFNSDKIYYVTRSYRMPGDSWQSYSMVVGPGCVYDVSEEPEDPEERTTTAPAVEETDLFFLSQDREANTVTFTTTADSGTLEIYTIAGNKVKTIGLRNEEFIYEMDAAACAKGLYIARVHSGARTTVKKFTIE